jgi:arylsulfatase A-like enzyme
MSSFNRRDFLKLAGLLPFGLTAPKLGKSFGLQSDKKNVIVIVFDAFSAYNISLYGYGRETTPNIARLAERATVYHNHYASSSYTTSGTASLLTGTYPWTHRALKPNSMVVDDYADRSIFSVFKDHYSIAYSHNEWVNTLFDQFKAHIDEYIPREQLTLFSSDRLVQKTFPNDRDIASVGWIRNVKRQEEGYAYSLFLSELITSLEERYSAQFRSQFPRGLPTARADGGFLLEHAIDWIVDRIQAATDPVLGYFHFLPPHDPYRTRNEFFGNFRNDGFKVEDKSLDIFAKYKDSDMQVLRQYYDEFILYVDREFGRMFDLLESSGKLEDTILVLTSDHGEMFERGIAMHDSKALYQPLIRIPLLIFEPGVTTRTDVYESTGAVDLLPTLAHLSGLPVPEWTEGTLLPPYQQSDTPADRSIYAVRSYDAEQMEPLSEASIVLVKGRYKLHYYFGYAEIDGKELVKLFDVQDDPGEMNDLSHLKKDVAGEMLKELKTKLKEADSPYVTKNSVNGS